MVAHLLRLKLTLLRNGLRRSPLQLIGLAIGGLYALGIVGTCVAALLFLAPIEPSVVERWYSERLYLQLQPPVTAMSNRLPFARTGKGSPWPALRL